MFTKFGVTAVILCSCVAISFAQSPTGSVTHERESQEPAEIANVPSPSATRVSPQSVPASERPGKRPKYDLTRIGSRGIGSGINTYSLEREARLGRRLAEEYQQTARLVRDPLINEYVMNLTNRLAEHSDTPMPFIVKIIDSDNSNAVAFPGGYLFVDAGLILATEDEAQLAGVIAHEIAHIVARHATRAQSKRFLIEMAAIPLSFSGPWGITAGLAGPISSAKFSRDAENEADLLGLQYMYSAGYDPGELLRLLENLSAGQPKERNPRVLRILIDAPAIQDRLAGITRFISTMLPPKDAYVVNTSEFDAAKNHLFDLGNYLGGKAREGIRPRLRSSRSPRPAIKPVPSNKAAPYGELKSAFNR